jgi:hypothetical protein
VKPLAAATPGLPPEPRPTVVPESRVPPASAVPITADSIPPSLQDDFDAYPLLPGTRLVWRVTGVTGGVNWSVEVITETMDGAWSITPSTANVRSALSAEVPYIHAFAMTETHASDTFWRAVSDDNRVATPDLANPLWGSLWHVIEEGITVDSPIGPLEGCYSWHETGGAGWGVYHWECPNIGRVRSEFTGCYGTHAYVTVSELDQWITP